MQLPLNVSLSARGDPTNTELRITYALRNNGAHDLYVLNAFGALDRDSRKPYVDTNGYSLFLADSGAAVVLLGVPPLPADGLVAVRIMPLGLRLAAGQEISGDVLLELPLTERSRYGSTVAPDQLRPVRANKLVLRVHCLRADTEGLVATPVAYGPNYFTVKTPRTVQDVQELQTTLLDRELVLRVVAR